MGQHGPNYRVHKKHLTVFEILKPVYSLHGVSILTTIMYSDVWSSVQMKQWSVQHHTAEVVKLSKQSLLQLDSVVSQSTFKDVMLLAAVMWYCGNWNGIKKDQWRRVNHKDIHVQLVHLTMWNKYDAILQSTCRPAWQQSLALCLNDSSGCWIHHKDLHCLPYIIRVAPELSGGGGKMSQLQFCDEFLDLVNNNHNTENTLLMADKAHFHAWLWE